MRIYRYHSWQWCLAIGLVQGVIAAPGDTRHDMPDVGYLASSKADDLPDFGNYIHLKTLEWTYFPNDYAEKRMIVVGDIHGMSDSLDNLLGLLNYSPSRDTLIHTGDVTYRGRSSLETLDFLAAHNVSGVRGNHDQRVVEWRAWIEWILKHKGGLEWLEEEERRTIEGVEGKAHGAQPSTNRNSTWKRIPEDWSLMGEHYRIARNMSASAASYLFSLPIALHIPQLHAFVVHGGILPSDPTKDLTAKSQPLAHLPISDDYESGGDDGPLATLRRAQERALLEDIPQNVDPWVLLNMRSVTRDNEVTKDGEDPDSTPWSEIWNSVVSLCKGFGKIEDSLDAGSKSGFSGGGNDDMQVIIKDGSSNLTRRHVHLPCHPSTIIYGHAATRGLDLKRWSKGLDSGCSYGRRLTALVLMRNGAPLGIDPKLGKIMQKKRTKFGERDLAVDAHIVSVPCTVPDPEGFV